MDERIIKVIDERIEHPFYPTMDMNKIGKKVIKMKMEELVKERQIILSELKQAIIYVLDESSAPNGDNK